MDPVSAAIFGGSNIVGGAMAGAANAKATKEGLNVEQLLGMRGLDVQSAAVGDQIRRQMESMPVRDRMLAQLQARMGQSPAAFNPAGMWGNKNQSASTGGVDQGALQRAASNYTPGSGGTRPDMAAQMMNRLGYTPTGNAGFGGAGGNDWQKTLGQQFSSAPQSWANTLVNTETGNMNTDPLSWKPAAGPGAWNPNGGLTGIAGSTPGMANAPSATPQQPDTPLPKGLGGPSTAVPVQPSTNPMSPAGPSSPPPPSAPNVGGALGYPPLGPQGPTNPFSPQAPMINPMAPSNPFSPPSAGQPSSNPFVPAAPQQPDTPLPKGLGGPSSAVPLPNSPPSSGGLQVMSNPLVNTASAPPSSGPPPQPMINPMAPSTPPPSGGSPAQPMINPMAPTGALPPTPAKPPTAQPTWQQTLARKLMPQTPRMM